MGGFFKNQRDASAPGFDEVDSAEQVGDKWIAAAGDFCGFECAQGDAFHEPAGIPHLNTVGENGDADFVGIPVVAVAKSVDDGFAEGFAVDLGDIDSGQAIEFHSDSDVLENVFFGFLDKGEDIAVEIVLVDNGRCGGSGENSAAECKCGRLCKENARGVQVVAIDMKAEALESGWGVGPRETCLADIGADLGGIGLEGGVWDRFRIPTAVAAVLAKDNGLDFLG